MDQLDILSGAERGTSVIMKKILPRGAPLVTSADRVAITGELARVRPASAVEEVQRQNEELLRALDELRRRQEELRQSRRGAGGHQSRRRHPDVIFLDLVLPDMGGSEVLATLKGDPALRAAWQQALVHAEA